METLGSLILCGTITLILITALCKKVPIFDRFLAGGKEGFETAIRIFPSIVGLTTAIGMLLSSGAVDVVSATLSPLVDLIGIPRETLPLALMRPISGSGALAVYRHVIEEHGPDGTVGLIASVMMGSTETTFYTIAVYFGSLRITKLRHTVPSALSADLTGFILSALTVRILLK